MVICILYYVARRTDNVPDPFAGVSRLAQVQTQLFDSGRQTRHFAIDQPIKFHTIYYYFGFFALRSKVVADSCQLNVRNMPKFDSLTTDNCYQPRRGTSLGPSWTWLDLVRPSPDQKSRSVEISPDQSRFLVQIRLLDQTRPRIYPYILGLDHSVSSFITSQV